MNKYSHLLRKAANIKLSQLCIIILYKIEFKIHIIIEKIIISQHWYRKSTGCLDTKKIDTIGKTFSQYFSLCTKDKHIVPVGEDLLNNKVTLFETQFHITQTDWLQDPVSKQYWNKDVFFFDSKVECAGYGDVKYVMELNKMYHLVTLAHAYYISKDEKYLIKISILLTEWEACVPYEKSVVNKSMLDIVFRCINLIHVSLLSSESDLFKKEIFPRIIDILRLSERHIRRFSTPRWCKYSSGANHTIGEMVGLIIIQQWLQYFTTNKYNKYLKQEYYYLHNSLNNIITKEGVYLEQSANYSRLVAEFLMLLDLFNNAIGCNKSKSCYSTDYLHRLLRYVVVLSNNSTLPNFGDNDGARAVSPFYENEYSVLHLIKYYRLLYPNEKEGNALLCEQSGQFIWKSNDEKNISVFIRSGKHSFLPIGSGSHAHNDILSLLLFAHNRELFIDSGTYLYNSGMEILNKDRATSSHNTISIKGVEQGSFSGKWMYGSYPTSCFIENETKIEATKFSFGGKCSYANRTHTRAMEYDNSCLLVNDKIECNDDDVIQISFLLGPFITAQVLPNNQVSLMSDGKSIAFMIFDKEMDVVVKDAFYHPSYAVEKNTTKIVGVSRKKGAQTILTKININ